MKYKSYATVLIDKNIQKPLDYGVPDHFLERIIPGSRVIVPLRSQKLPATVLHIRSKTALESVHPIHDVLLEENILSDDLFKLAQWMSEYYATSLQKVVKAMIPSSIKGKTKEKSQLYIERNQPEEKIIQLCAEIRRKRPAQAKVLETVLLFPKGVLLSELLEKSSCSASSVHELIKQEVLKTKLLHIDRLSLTEQEFFPSPPKILNEEQIVCFEKISAAIESGTYRPFLIHGVTGSGKTEIYLRSIQKALDLNKDVIFLVPEIALTSQTIERLRARFQNKIAILHHRLSDGERFDSWHQMRKGTIHIVVGARSALFSPLKNVGLIIVDEEQESSYKQTEEMPTYHARDVAVVRAKMMNATVLLGSATPCLESYHNALSGKYELLELKKRASNSKLPHVILVDMNIEKEKKNFSLFSDLLLRKMKDRFEKGEQTLIFLNRRGFYSYLTCTECGQAVKCPHCDVSMTFHKKEDQLSCHLCGFNLSPCPKSCPHCKSDTIKFQGPGTEHVERSIRAIFPQIRTLRMDADTTKHKGSHDLLFRSFKSGKADVLIGTQMVAKGLHFPSITLVGVLNADQGLHVPDFRATEQTFQLLTQVSGRSGRSNLQGEVIIQTQLKEHMVMVHASHENYPKFYDEEIEIRKLFDYPPFKKIVKIVFTGDSEAKTLAKGRAFQSSLLKKLPPTFNISQVVPCGCAKIKNHYRFQFIIKGLNPSYLSKILKEEFETHKNHSIKILIDIDPVITFS